jgi:hypothetical protein
VCCQVEVSATSWSLAQRSTTDRDASLCVILKPREWGGPGPLGAVAPKTNKTTILVMFFYLLGYSVWWALRHFRSYCLSVLLCFCLDVRIHLTLLRRSRYYCGDLSIISRTCIKTVIRLVGFWVSYTAQDQNHFLSNMMRWIMFVSWCLIAVFPSEPADL